MDTKTDVVLLVQKLAPHAERTRLEKRAARGCYHDFETESAMPKTDLVTDLMELFKLTGDAGYKELASCVAAGDFDEPAPRPKVSRK